MKRIRVVKFLGGRELREIFVGNKREIISLRKNLKRKLDFKERLFTAHNGDKKIKEAKLGETLAIVIEKEDKLYRNTFKILNKKEFEILGEKIILDNWVVTKFSGE